MIDPIPEYFNDNISPCDSNACLTCNSFISDQSFKSAESTKLKPMSNLPVDHRMFSTAIHCIRCGLMYVGETGIILRSWISLRSWIIGH